MTASTSTSSGGNEKDGISFDEMDVVDASTHHHQHSGKKRRVERRRGGAPSTSGMHSNQTLKEFDTFCK